MLRKNYCLFNWICLGTCVLTSSMMSAFTKSPLIKFATSTELKSEQPNTTDQGMHSGESERKSGNRFDSNWILTSQTVDLLITRSDDSSSKFDIEIQNRDKNAMVHSMEDCHSINSWHQDWSFDYKYTRDEVNSLLCKCFKICHTVMPEVRDVLKLREYFHNPLSDINLTRFIIVMSIYSTIFLVGVIGNVLTIFGLLKWVRSKTPTLSFILNMAIIDLVLLLICVPLKLAETFKLTHDIGLVRCKLLYYFRDFTFVCSIFTMCVISFERYYAICHPLEVQYKCTKKRTRIIIVTIWIVSAVFAVPTIFAMKSYTSVYDILDEQTCRQNFSKDIYLQLFCIYYLGILFLLPLLIMLYTYGCSCVALKKSANRSKVLQNIGAISTISFDGPNNSEKEGHNYQGRIKVIKMLIIILITFTFCWGPSLILRVLVIYKVAITNRWLITQIFDILIFINSCSSPYIFMCMSSQFKTAATDACSCLNCFCYPCHIVRDRHYINRLQRTREFSSEISVTTRQTSVCSISVES